MGLFGSLMDFLDEDSPNSLENTMNRMLDGVESAVGGAVETAEQGIQKLDTAVTSVQTGAENLVKRADVAMTKIDGGQERIKSSLQSIDGFIKPKSSDQ